MNYLLSAVTIVEVWNELFIYSVGYYLIYNKRNYNEIAIIKYLFRQTYPCGNA